MCKAPNLKCLRILHQQSTHILKKKRSIIRISTTHTYRKTSRVICRRNIFVLFDRRSVEGPIAHQHTRLHYDTRARQTGESKRTKNYIEWKTFELSISAYVRLWPTAQMLLGHYTWRNQHAHTRTLTNTHMMHRRVRASAMSRAYQPTEKKN